MSRERLRGVAAILPLGLLTIVPAATAGDATGWDRQAAARYLDGRARDWETFKGADRGQGKDRVSCISCHTSLSYALGRPALRAPGTNQAVSPQETRLLADVKRRVEHWSELDTPRFRLSYDFDERKKVESWGTEAVLNALVLATDDRRSGRSDASASTRLAFRHLWSTQQKEGKDAGSWDWLDFGLRPWEAGEARYYGATLAAIAIGTVPGMPDAEARAGIERLRHYLGSHFGEQNLHNQMFALWASAWMDALLTGSQRQAVVEAIRSKQQPDGGWSLSALVDCRRQDKTPQEKGSDGYATGLAVHVLRLAGEDRSSAMVAKGLTWLQANQQPAGNWVGHSLNKRRDPKTHVGKFMSDAATALAILALEDR